jgi:hypothetical protein
LNTENIMTGSVANLAKSSAVALLAGGLPFSFALLHLGADMASPELLRYALIASIPFPVILIGIALKFGNSRFYILFGQVCWWSIIACVPLEAVTYLCSAWSLKEATLFSKDELPTLLLLLALWSVILAVPSTLLAALVTLIRARSSTSRTS